MKKNLAMLCVLGCFAQPVLAADINLSASGFLKSEFKTFSEDLGAALSYKAVTPAESLGVTGFDVGVEVTSTQVKDAALWTRAAGSSRSSLLVPKVHVHKGLPLNFDVGAFYASVPTTSIKLFGGELRYAILAGGVATPAVAVRASITKLSGVNQLSFDTKGLDISISKGFAMFTPYAGIGNVWVNSTANVAGLGTESFRQSKVFVGGNLNLGLTNLAVEMDKTGSISSVSAKVGFRF